MFYFLTKIFSFVLQIWITGSFTLFARIVEEGLGIVYTI